MDNKDLVAIFGGKRGEGPGGDVTAAAVLTALQAMSNAQAAAALTAIDGESKKLTVTITESGGVYSADKTFTEIKAAYDAGKTVEAVYDGHIFRLFDINQLGAEFMYFLDDTADGNVFEQYLGVTSANAWTHTARTLVPAPTTVTGSGSTQTIAMAADNTIYECGEVSSLTVTDYANPGSFIISFVSGSTPTVLTLPASLDARMPSSFTFESDSFYEINVRNGYPFVAACPEGSA